MRALLLISTTSLIVLVVALVGMTLYAFALRRKIKGLNNPVLWLPRSERRSHARELLRREQTEYDLLAQKRANEVIFGQVPSTERKEDQ